MTFQINNGLVIFIIYNVFVLKILPRANAKNKCDVGSKRTNTFLIADLIPTLNSGTLIFSLIFLMSLIEVNYYLQKWDVNESCDQIIFQLACVYS